MIIITGALEPEDVFAALEPEEAKAYERGKVTSTLLKRPFTTDYPPLAEDVDEVPTRASAALMFILGRLNIHLKLIRITKFCK